MTTKFYFGLRSEKNLQGVHPDLVKVARRALELSPIDFCITEGRRSIERQRQLVAEKKSQTMNSRHITGHAVDVFALPTSAGSWDMQYYRQIAAAFKQAGDELKIPVEWGGNWTSFKDGPHFQLSVKTYPA
ncbi:peptidoglycan L-alanyl-D-glutamate endopeptidase CwlK [Serratia fonticola]|jgi:peptidoglycan L-alanyl-D-glutamate endopeptidase CwlK|uniref:Peptidoglycan L-alanyl-D-glutamate endopeptidase CwlK n=1 Tax=Serratia fonticola TaxID=47917 RepID=A0A559TCY6_SERFO|nr:M15 family metallopeptidase [Serratia fonticola]TQI79991.1 peptidoglycan L-alanyl-D-glutamate endopeptidase CwlK [Serratia fonticola]TQI97983.1 peptidoglycan L-alanyl-D-glutamate endopeptidase CwlK [Serratia fonticola]TVZ72478.1 peptidoglycan L-alanyl-D-glutamate endopeptidase CwlK [Serratia fonticola]